MFVEDVDRREKTTQEAREIALFPFNRKTRELFARPKRARGDTVRKLSTTIRELLKYPRSVRASAIRAGDTSPAGM